MATKRENLVRRAVERLPLELDEALDLIEMGASGILETEGVGWNDAMSGSSWARLEFLRHRAAAASSYDRNIDKTAFGWPPSSTTPSFNDDIVRIEDLRESEFNDD